MTESTMIIAVVGTMLTAQQGVILLLLKTLIDRREKAMEKALMAMTDAIDAMRERANDTEREVAEIKSEQEKGKELCKQHIAHCSPYQREIVR